MSVECLTTRAALGALAPEWNELWSSTPDGTPFQTPAWLLPWWDAFHPGELRVLALRSHGLLSGVVPLYVADSREGQRELRLLGEGVSDYLDAVGAAKQISEVVRDVLEGWRGDWHACVFSHLPPTSPLLQIAFTSGLEPVDAPDLPCPVVYRSRDGTLPVTTEQRLKKARKERRHAVRSGGAVEHATAGSVQRMLSSLFELHGSQWRARGAPGVFADAAVRRFHRAAAPALLRRGLLRMCAWTMGTRVASVQYAFYSGTRLYLYIAGAAPEFAALSAGRLALAATIEQALDEGATAIDFLGGAEAYKYTWGGIDSRRVTREIRARPSTID